MSETLTTAISTLSQQRTELEAMIETFSSEQKQLRRDLTLLDRMQRQCSEMHSPNGFRKSIEDHRTILEETLLVYENQIRDCKREYQQLRRALSILNA